MRRRKRAAGTVRFRETVLRESKAIRRRRVDARADRPWASDARPRQSAKPWSRSTTCHHDSPLEILQRRQRAAQATASNASLADAGQRCSPPVDSSHWSIWFGASIASSRERRGFASARFDSHASRGSELTGSAIPQRIAPAAFFRLPARRSANWRCEIGTSAIGHMSPPAFPTTNQIARCVPPLHARRGRRVPERFAGRGPMRRECLKGRRVNIRRIGRMNLIGCHRACVMKFGLKRCILLYRFMENGYLTGWAIVWRAGDGRFFRNQRCGRRLYVWPTTMDRDFICGGRLGRGLLDWLGRAAGCSDE